MLIFLLLSHLILNSNKFLIRFFRGIQLKDMISFHTVLPDWIDGDKINFRKLKHIASILDQCELEKCDEYLCVDPNLVDTLRVDKQILAPSRLIEFELNTCFCSR